MQKFPAKYNPSLVIPSKIHFKYLLYPLCRKKKLSQCLYYFFLLLRFHFFFSYNVFLLFFFEAGESCLLKNIWEIKMSKYTFLVCLKSKKNIYFFNANRFFIFNVLVGGGVFHPPFLKGQRDPMLTFVK